MRTIVNPPKTPGGLRTVEFISRWTINNPAPRRYHVTHNEWGNACHLREAGKYVVKDGLDNGVYYPCTGHLSPPAKAGDEVVVPFGRGPIVCQFVEVENSEDPKDRFRATVRLLGYLKDVGTEPGAVTTPLGERTPLRTTRG